MGAHVWKRDGGTSMHGLAEQQAQQQQGQQQQPAVEGQQGAGIHRPHKKQRVDDPVSHSAVVEKQDLQQREGHQADAAAPGVTASNSDTNPSAAAGAQHQFGRHGGRGVLSGGRSTHGRHAAAAASCSHSAHSAAAAAGETARDQQQQCIGRGKGPPHVAAAAGRGTGRAGSSMSRGGGRGRGRLIHQGAATAQAHASTPAASLEQQKEDAEEALRRKEQEMEALKAKIREQQAKKDAQKLAQEAKQHQQQQQQELERRKNRLNSAFGSAFANAAKAKQEQAKQQKQQQPAAPPPDDEAEVKRVLGSKNDYEVLQLKPGCDAAALKRRYRELAVRLHPDKCKAADASLAFQRAHKAYQALQAHVL